MVALPAAAGAGALVGGVAAGIALRRHYRANDSMPVLTAAKELTASKGRTAAKGLGAAKSLNPKSLSPRNLNPRNLNPRNLSAGFRPARRPRWPAPRR
jgi:hypothetical protein